jgi:hypothetical protein
VPYLSPGSPDPDAGQSEKGGVKKRFAPFTLKQAYYQGKKRCGDNKIFQKVAKIHQDSPAG